MLISTVGSRPYTDLRLPSHPNGIVIPSNPVPNNIPIKMRRKIFIVNDHLAVGAAGDVMSIRAFIDDISETFHDRPHFESVEIKDYLNDYATSPLGQAVFKEIGFVMLVEGDRLAGFVEPWTGRRRRCVQRQVWQSNRHWHWLRSNRR